MALEWTVDLALVMGFKLAADALVTVLLAFVTEKNPHQVEVVSASLHSLFLVANPKTVLDVDSLVAPSELLGQSAPHTFLFL